MASAREAPRLEAAAETEQDRETGFESELRHYLQQHVVDMAPGIEGNEKSGAELAGAAFGCTEVLIGRCDPHLQVENLKLERGKSVVLIGPNGAGKSTLFDAIMDTKDVQLSARFGEGAVAYGKPVHTREKTRISRLNQDELLSSLEGIRAEEALRTVAGIYLEEFEIDWSDPDKFDDNLKNEETRQRIEELQGRLAKLFSIEEFLDRNVEELSGGERTKLSLCMILMSEPDVLLLDEPTNHLDMESISKLSGLLESYLEAGVSVLSASHVPAYLEKAGKGGVVEIKMNENAREVTASGAPYARYIKDRSREDFTIIKEGIDWPVPTSRKTGALITPVMDEVTVPDSPLVNINMRALLPNDVWVLSGNNGAGKTKLMEAMADNRSKSHIREKGASIAYMPQFWPEDVATGTMEDFFSWIKKGVNPRADVTPNAFVKAIQATGFRRKTDNGRVGQSLLNMPVASFSGGEQRLLWFIAVSCFRNVDALLLDEPTNHMDGKLQAVITEAIRNFQGAVVFSTHDLQLLEAISADVGKKGTTMAPRNVTLEKRDGMTRVEISAESPASYIRNKMEKAHLIGKRTKI